VLAHPGDGAPHQTRSYPTLAVGAEHGEAPQLPDPHVVRDDLRVSDGDATERRHVHEPRFEIPADRRRRVVGKLEQRPELVP
jgi:hypothetical protein